MALVEKRHPHLLPFLKDLDPAPTDPSQPDNFQFQGIWLHDTLKPGNECANHFIILPEDQPGVAIFLGLGLGHGALKLIHERPKVSHFFIFERHPQVFLQALFQKDLTPLLSDPRVYISIGDPDDIMEILKPGVKALRLESIYTLQHPPSVQADPEGYETLRQSIFKEVNQLNISGNTLMQHGDTFFINRMALLPLLQRHHLLEELKFAFKGIPAILIAGGPSLNQDIETLKKFPGHAILFAVDTVLSLLATKNIVPDFVSSLDYEKATYEKFASAAPLVADKVSLISMPFICQKVPKVFPFKEIFWAFTSANMERWINQLIGGSLENGGAGTVAHMNFIAAVVLGCSPIVLLGQDLAYTQDENTHAEGTVLSESKAVKELRFSDNKMIVPTNNGGTALTSRAYYNFKHVFEDMIKANPGHYINATLPGIIIEGTEVMPLGEVFETFCQNTIETRNTVKNYLEKNMVLKKTPASTEKELYGILKTIQKLQRILKECREDGKRCLKEVNTMINAGKTYKNIDVLPERIRKTIHKVDKAHNQADKEKIWSLIDDLTLYGLKKTERMQLEIDRLAETGPFLKWLSLSLERLNEVARIRLHWINFLGEKIQTVLDTMKGDPIYHPSKGHAILDQIRYYHQTGNLRFASQLLPKLEEKEKESHEILLIQGKIAAIHTEYEKAKACFKALKNTRYEKDINYFLEEWGNEYAEYTEWALYGSGTMPALRMLKKGLAMAPEHHALKNLLARIFRMDLKTIQRGGEEGNTLHGMWENWLSETPEAPERLPKKEYALFLDLCAKKEMKQNKHHEAKKLLELALSKEENATRRIKAMDTCFVLEDFNEGLEHLEKAVEQDPKLATHWENIGDRLQGNGLEESAIEAYHKGLTALPEHSPFYLKAGQILLSSGHIEEARQYLQAYKDLMEKDPEEKKISELDTAENLLARGEKEKALATLVPLQDTHEKDSRFWNLFGTACQMTGRIGDAERCFRQAIFLQPDYAQAHYHLGLLFHENGYTKEATEAYQETLHHDPSFVHAHTNLGTLAFSQKDYQTASMHFEKAMDLNPLDANTHFNYAKAMDLLGERQKALRAFKCAMELNPGHIQAREAHEHLLQHKTI